MKYLKQFLIILAITFLGELVKYLLPFPIPASIYGMILLFAALMTGIVKLEQVRDTGRFLIEIMPAMMIPAGVGLMVSWDALKKMLIPVIIITLVSYFPVQIVTGHIAQFIIRRKEEKVNE